MLLSFCQFLLLCLAWRAWNELQNEWDGDALAGARTHLSMRAHGCLAQLAGVLVLNVKLLLDVAAGTLLPQTCLPGEGAQQLTHLVRQVELLQTPMYPLDDTVVYELLWKMWLIGS